MSDTLVAKRYAEALYDFAESVGTIDRVDADVSMLGDALGTSRDLSNFFRSPVISREKKSAVIQRLLGNRVGSTFLKFLDQLVEKRREDIVDVILSAYRDLRDRQLGVAKAVTRSASALSDEEMEDVRRSLERITGKKIRLMADTDRALIGGLIVRIEDTVYDGSVRNKLNQLREQLQAG